MNSISNLDKKRFLDLANRSYRNNQYTFTDFLTLAQVSDLKDMLMLPKDHPERIDPNFCTLFGGYDKAERVIARFGSESELGYEMPFPIIFIKIVPLMKKFADELSHRDFLGALMNLGINRDELGDILINGSECCLIAKESMADLICLELTRIRHTSVMATITDTLPQNLMPRLEAGQITAKSVRIDSFIAKICKVSRGDAAKLFLSDKVFVNGRLMNNESYQLKSGDIISVRGFGRLVFNGVGKTTAKGNFVIDYMRYV